MKTQNRILALILALALAFSLAACGKDPEPAPAPESQPEQNVEKFFVNMLVDNLAAVGLSYLDKVAEYYEINSDTVGWLVIPGTAINDVVVCKQEESDENNYYYRRNFKKENSQAGVFYADFRCRFGDGLIEELPQNNVIYGHTLSGNWDGPMFAPLKYFTEEEFARRTPYIYFSSAQEDLVYEVFSVMYATTDLPYNHPEMKQDEYTTMVGECIKRSIYTYDTQVTATDKIITLSTCTYSLPGVGQIAYPSKYRYVVMGKLIDKADATKTEASFELNPSPKAP